jgi:hypothetical protein
MGATISDRCARSGCGHARGVHTGIAGRCIVRADGCRCRRFVEAPDEDDLLLLEAMREVDALTPSAPALAPAIEDRIRSDQFVEMMKQRAAKVAAAAAAADEERARMIAVAKMVGTHEDARIRRRMYRDDVRLDSTASDGCPQEVHDDGKCLHGLAVER